MRSSTKRILSVLLSAFFLIGLVFVITSLVKPEFERVMKKRSEVYSKEQIFANRSKAVEKVDSLIKDTEGFDKLRNTISLAIPLEMKVPNILSQLDAIARTSNVSITSFDTNPQAFIEGKGQLTKRLGVIEVSLVAHGDYSDLKDFLRFLETNVRVFNVQSYEFISKRIEKTGNMSYNLSVQFDAYYQES